MRTLWIGLVVGPLVASPAHAQAPVSVRAAVSPQDGPAEVEATPALEMRELPVESRTDVADFVGRNLPGASLGRHGLLLRGGDAGDTALLVDGFRFRHLAIPLALVERLDVATAGYGARWTDVAGGTVELTTRRESNRWHASGEIFHDFRDRVVSDAAASASGPIVRDRLFFLVGVEGALSRDPTIEDPVLGRAPRVEARRLAGALKVSWLTTARHRLDSLTILDGDRSDNGAGVLVEPEAQPTFSTRTLFTSLRWLGQFGDAVTARASAGVSNGTVGESPMSCRWDPEHCNQVAPIRDLVSSIVRQNALRRETQRDRGLDLEGRLDAVFFRGERVDEQLQLTSRLGLRDCTTDLSVPGNAVFSVAQAMPIERSEVTPNHTTSSSVRTVHALESTTRLWGRVSLIPGLALVTSSARNSGGVEVRDHLLTPHAAILWDIRGDGHWLVRASTHRRVDADLDRFARFSAPPPVQNRCRWDDVAAQYLSCQMLGGVSPPVDEMRMPRTWEHTAGVESAVGDFRLGLDAVYRRTGDLPGAGYLDQGLITLPGYHTRYRGVTASAAGRRGPAQVFVAYTLSRHDDRHDLPDDRRHAFEAMASYDLFGHGWVSGLLTWESGRPVEPVVFRHIPGIFEDYAASRVTDPLPGFTSGGDRDARLRATKRFNLQARLRGKRLLKIDIDLWADVINVFDWGLIPLNDPFTLQTSYRIQEGRSARLGLEYRY